VPFLDIDSSFSLNSVGDLKVVSGTDAINQSLRNILLTPVGFRPGEYRNNSTYGIGMKDFLFEKANPFTASEMRNIIVDKINFYEPRINLEAVNVKILDDHTYRVDIEYVMVAGTKEIIDFKLVLDQV
jgi:phage baseplate assembly protein W